METARWQADLLVLTEMLGIDRDTGKPEYDMLPRIKYRHQYRNARTAVPSPDRTLNVT